MYGIYVEVCVRTRVGMFERDMHTEREKENERERKRTRENVLYTQTHPLLSCSLSFINVRVSVFYVILTTRKIKINLFLPIISFKNPICTFTVDKCFTCPHSKNQALWLKSKDQILIHFKRKSILTSVEPIGVDVNENFQR